MLKLNSNEMLSQHIERFWEIDIYGNKNSAKQNLLSPSESKALQILEKEIFKEDQFEVAYCGKTKLQYYLMIVKWHYSAFINYRKNLPDFKTLYQKQIKEYIKNGHAKKLDQNEMTETSNISNYLPHHGVCNVNKNVNARL